MAKPRALDLFCGAGGAAAGLARAGFEVHGVDIKAQPRYPFWFRRAGWTAVELEGFELIWASPPCQPFSSMTRKQDRHKQPSLIAPLRAALERSSALYVIENVPRAPIRPDVILQGDMFGLGVVRRRHFETNFHVEQPRLTSGRGLVKEGLAVTVAGGGKAGDIARWSAAMGIDWQMTRREVVNAVPPAYAEHIARWAARAIDDISGAALGQVGPGQSWPSEAAATL